MFFKEMEGTYDFTVSWPAPESIWPSAGNLHQCEQGHSKGHWHLFSSKWIHRRSPLLSSQSCSQKGIWARECSWKRRRCCRPPGHYLILSSLKEWINYYLLDEAFLISSFKFPHVLISLDPTYRSRGTYFLLDMVSGLKSAVFSFQLS